MARLWAAAPPAALFGLAAAVERRCLAGEQRQRMARLRQAGLQLRVPVRPFARLQHRPARPRAKWLSARPACASR